MKLSYSAISNYQTCPLQYMFKYVERRPTAPSPSLSFGMSLHEALRWFYDVPTADPYPLEELLGYLEACWVSEGYCSAEEETRYFYQAKSALALFYRNSMEEFKLPAAIEHRFLIDVGFCELSGVIDRLDKDPMGDFEIIDYKTNRRLPPARRLYQDLQLPIYHLAAERVWEVAPGKVTFYYLLMNHRHSFAITRERIESALAEIESVAVAISSGRFDPCRNNLCPWCDFLDICPEWEGKVRPQKKTGVPAMDVGEAVDELIIAEKKVSQALSRIEALRGIVASYLRDKDIEKVGGSRGIAYMDEDGNLGWREID